MKPGYDEFDDASRLDDDDRAFDLVYPAHIRDLSSVHWTPVRVARRAAELLDLSPSSRVLDVGSGAGKFCLAAALHSPATFVGMERRRGLIDVAERARAALGCARAQFTHVDALQADWTPFDALYFYNPLGEHFLDEIERIDGERFGMGEYSRAVMLIQVCLNRLFPGTRVALYHGMGGSMPSAFRLLRKEPCGTGAIEIWQKEEDPQLPDRHSQCDD